MSPFSCFRRVLCLLSVGWFFALGARGATWEQSTAVVDRFGFVELTLRLDEAPAGNPFADVSLTAAFGPEGGPRRQVEGFCDDPAGLVHRIRLMPTTTGRHDYRVVAKVGRMQTEHAGSFRARAGRSAGLLRVDPAHPQHFLQTGNGRHFFWNSTTAYWLLGFTDDAVIRASLDRLAGLGINRIRLALSGRTRSGGRWKEDAIKPTEAFRFRLEPWPSARPEDIENPGYDVTRFNPGHFQRLERLVAHAAKRGIQVSLIFQLDGRDPGVDPFGPAGMGGMDEQRYYRYVVARMAAFPNVMWDVTNEWHLFRDEAWVERMGALIRRCDPYEHLTSVHGKSSFPFRNSSWVDYVMFQSWDEQGGYGFMLRQRREQADSGRPLPVVNEEYGYEDHYPFPWGQARRWPARAADTRRRLAWEITMAGGYQTTGERADVPGYGGWITGRGNAAMTLLVGYGHLRRFFEGFDWWKLEPCKDLVVPASAPPPEHSGSTTVAGPSPTALPVLRADPMCLAETGRRYVVYLPRGGDVSLALPTGNYRARWFDPRAGRFLGGTRRTQRDGTISATAPDALDWVWLVERMNRE